MNRSRRSSLLCAMACVLCVSFVNAVARAQVLEQLPDDAVVVVKIKDLQSVSTKVAALAQQFGISQARPEFSDPLQALGNMSGIKQGMDKSGDAAFVVLNGEWKEQQPPFLILLPISNYQEFIGNFANPKKDGEFDVIHMKGEGGEEEKEDTYVSDWGKYASLSPTKDALKKGTGLKVTGAAAKELETKDLTAFFNFKVLGPKLLPQLKENKDKLIDQITDAMSKAPNANPKFAPVVKAMFQQYIAIAEGFLTDAQSAVISLDLSNDGIATTSLAEFTPGSYSANAVTALRNTDGPLTAGLPDGKYIFYGGLTINGPEMTKLMDDLVAPVVVELNKLGDDSKGVTTYLNSMHTILSNITGEAVGVIAPSGPLGQSPLLQAVYSITGDSKKLTVGMKEMTESTDQLMGLLGASGFPKFNSTFTPNAKTIEGVSFDAVQLKPDPAAANNSPEAMQMQQMMAFMYGPNGATTVYGAVDDQHVVAGLDLDDDTLAAAVKAIKANDDPVGKQPQVAAANKFFPKSRVGVFYFAVDTLATTVADYARKMGMPVPLNLKPNLPPLAAALSTEGTTIRVDGYISADTVSNMVAAVMQVMMRQGGGPGGL